MAGNPDTALLRAGSPAERTSSTFATKNLLLRIIHAYSCTYCLKYCMALKEIHFLTKRV